MYRKQKILAYNPYLENLGGGEKFFFDVLDSLKRQVKEYEINVINDSKYSSSQFNEKFEERFGYKINSGIKFISVKGPKLYRYFKIVFVSVFYDFFISTTNEFPHLNLSKRFFCILQYPYLKEDIFSKLRKVFHYSLPAVFICYSDFVKNQVIKKTNTHNKVTVLPPMSVLPSQLPILSMKNNIIISVGRFFKGEHSKGHDYMIDFFKELYDTKLIPGDAALVLIGGASMEMTNYIKQLQEKASGYPIQIIPNASKKVLDDFLKEAKVYWHFAGYASTNKTEDSAEHFGITVVEAMSRGVVPIVYAQGGPVEIVGYNQEYGYHWKTFNDLATKTKKVLNESYETDCTKAFYRTREYNKDTFDKRVSEIFLS